MSRHEFGRSSSAAWASGLSPAEPQAAGRRCRRSTKQRRPSFHQRAHRVQYVLHRLQRKGRSSCRFCSPRIASSSASPNWPSKLRDYQGRPVTIVGVLTGCLMFLADLVRHLDLPLRIGLIQASSYRGAATTPGELRISPDLLPDVRGRHVLLLDDILDTGQTLVHLKKHLESVGLRFGARRRAAAQDRPAAGAARAGLLRLRHSRTPSSSATVSTITTSIGICPTSVSCRKSPSDFSKDAACRAKPASAHLQPGLQRSGDSAVLLARRLPREAFRVRVVVLETETPWVEELRRAGLRLTFWAGNGPSMRGRSCRCGTWFKRTPCVCMCSA